MLVIGALIAVFAIGVLLRSNSGTNISSDQAEPQAQVEVKVAHPASVTDTLGFDAQGVVTAKGSVSVTSLSEGRIGTAYLSVGQPVKRGQAVALLENRELDIGTCFAWNITEALFI